MGKLHNKQKEEKHTLSRIEMEIEEEIGLDLDSENSLDSTVFKRLSKKRNAGAKDDEASEIDQSELDDEIEKAEKELDEENEEIEESAENLDLSASEEEEEEEGGDDEDEEDLPDFIVDDDVIEYLSDDDELNEGISDAETPIVRKSIKGKNRPKKNPDARVFLDEETSNGKRRREDEEEEYDMELPMDKNLKVDEPIVAHYTAFVTILATYALRPEWKSQIPSRVEQARESGQMTPALRTISKQLKAEKLVNKISETAICYVLTWLHDGMHRDKACGQLLYLLFKNDKGNIKWMEFEKLPNAHNQCAISHNFVSKGHGWCAKIYKMDDTVKEDIIDTKWFEFLAYWQFLVKHNDLIQATASAFFAKLGDDMPWLEKLEAFTKSTLPMRFLKVYMASLAWFYKCLSGSKASILFGMDIDHRWYNVVPKTQSSKK